MLNVFYWYSIIWSTILFLYEMQLSDFYEPLNLGLLFFLISSIIICFLLGYKYRYQLRYRELKNPPRKRSRILTYLVVGLSILEMGIARNIPLIFIPLGLARYGSEDFSGLPIIHVFIVNTAIFYSTYLFYLYLETKKRSLLIESIALMFCLLLMYQKGATLFCLFCIINLVLAKLRINDRLHTTWKSKTIIALAIIAILYINGGLTNLRYMLGWNDNSFIHSLGRINSNWPAFIPEQMAWAYSYAISPIFNLNNNIISNTVFDISRLFVNIIPVSISESFWPDALVRTKEIVLVSPALNACTGYISPVVVAGNIGLWVMYVIEIIVSMIVVSFSKKSDHYPVYLVLMSMIVVFMFFYNTFTYSATSYIFLLLLFLYYFNRTNIKFGKHAIN